MTRSRFQQEYNVKLLFFKEKIQLLRLYKNSDPILLSQNQPGSAIPLIHYELACADMNASTCDSVLNEFRISAPE